MRKIIIMMILLLSGCGTIQMSIVDKKINPFVVGGKAVEVREVQDLITVKDDLGLIPDTKIDFRFYKGVTINDFCNALSQGLPEMGFMIDFVEPENKFIIPRFNGKLKDLFQLLQEAYGFSYRVIGNNIIIRDSCQVVIKVPSVIAGKEADIKDMMSIFQINPDDIHIDLVRGVVVSIMTSNQYYKLKKYLHDYGIYQYQIDIAVIEDTSTKSKTVGLDLSQVSAAISNSMSVGAVKAVGTTLSLVSTGSATATTIGIGSILTLDTVIAAYGSLNEIRMDQRIKIGVLSGFQAHVDLSRKIPYVSQITAVSSGVNSEAVTGYSFETAQDGLIIDVKPSGDDESINLSTSVNYQQIISYLQIKAGIYVISRPIVQARSYKAEYCIRPGEVTLIGSLRVLEDSSTQSGLVENKTYEDKNVVVRDLSILMGVSVIKYKMI
jgi:hypothetical protein